MIRMCQNEFLPSSLRDATSLQEGGFGKTGSFPSSPEAPSVRELSSECETEGVLSV